MVRNTEMSRTFDKHVERYKYIQQMIDLQESKVEIVAGILSIVGE